MLYINTPGTPGFVLDLYLNKSQGISEDLLPTSNCPEKCCSFPPNFHKTIWFPMEMIVEWWTFYDFL